MIIDLHIEVFARFASIGMMTSLCLLFLQHGLKTRLLLFAFAFNLSLISLLLVAGSDGWVLPSPLSLPFNIIADYHFLCAWLFGVALFEEDFVLGRREKIFLVIYCLAPIGHLAWLMGLNAPWLEFVRMIWVIMSAIMMLDLAIRAIKGRETDLIEIRRKERIRFGIGVSLLLIMVLVLSEVFVAFELVGFRLLFLLALPYCALINLWLLRFHPETLAFLAMRQNVTTENNLSPRDKIAHGKLVSLMEEAHIYREHGLTIGILAGRMQTPEHQLRRLINNILGHRNFTSFLNEYRIGAAEKMLCDPEKIQVPVLTIAMDAGYATVTPFNAAFKAKHNCTPSMFRRRHFEQPAFGQSTHVPAAT